MSLANLKRLLTATFIAVAVFLSACGGGGGSGGSAGPSGDGPDAGSAPAISMTGADVAVDKAAIHVIAVSNMALSEDTYHGDVDGYEVTLARNGTDELVILLPPDLSAGEHVLSVVIGESTFQTRFETAVMEVMAREDSITMLDHLFLLMRGVIDEAVQAKVDIGAPQGEIDELLSYKDLLDTQNDQYAEMSEIELDYLARLFDGLVNGGMTGVSSKSTFFSPACDQKVGEYFFELTATVLLIGVAAISSSTGVGFIAAAGASVLILSKARSVAEAYEAVWDLCVFAEASKLEAEISSGKSLSYGVSSKTIINQGEDNLYFTADIPVQYRVRTTFGIYEKFLAMIPDVQSLVSKFSFFIPDEIEEFISSHSDGYTSFVSSGMLSIEDISAANVVGQISIVDEDSFTIRFNVAQPFSGDPVFSFSLYDQENDIKTVYSVNLDVPPNCPNTLESQGSVLELEDKCIAISYSGDQSQVHYREYRKQLLELHEIYVAGFVENLKVVKGLEAYDEVADYIVGRRLSRTENSVFQDNLAGWRSLPYTYFSYDVAGEEEYIKQYSLPLQNPDGEWLSLIEIDFGCSRTGTYYERRQCYYSSPLLDASGFWVSVIEKSVGFDNDVMAYTEVHYSAPLQSSEGSWSSIPQQVLSYRYDGSLRYQRDYSIPLQNEDGSWASVYKEYQQYNDNGFLATHTKYSEPLPNHNFTGVWTSLATETFGYLEDGSPQYERYYHPHKQNPDGEWVYLLSYTISYGAAGNDEQFYSSPLQNEDGSWVTIRVNFYVEGQLYEECTPTYANGVWRGQCTIYPLQ